MRWNLKETVSKSLVRRTEITYKARLREISWLNTTKSKKLEDGLYSIEYKGDYRLDLFLEQGGAADDLAVAEFVVRDAGAAPFPPRYQKATQCLAEILTGEAA